MKIPLTPYTVGHRHRRGNRQGRGRKSKQPKDEGRDNATPTNADEAPLKVYLRCKYHPGNLVYKVSPFQVWKRQRETDIIPFH